MIDSFLGDPIIIVRFWRDRAPTARRGFLPTPDITARIDHDREEVMYIVTTGNGALRNMADYRGARVLVAAMENYTA